MTYNYIMDLSTEEENTNVENVENENVTEETAEPSNVDNFISTLPVMGKGMLGIFIVTAAIILTVILLNKFTSKPPKKETEDQ